MNHHKKISLGGVDSEEKYELPESMYRFFNDLIGSDKEDPVLEGLKKEIEGLKQALDKSNKKLIESREKNMFLEAVLAREQRYETLRKALERVRLETRRAPKKPQARKEGSSVSRERPGYLGQGGLEYKSSSQYRKSRQHEPG